MCGVAECPPDVQYYQVGIVGDGGVLAGVKPGNVNGVPPMVRVKRPQHDRLSGGMGSKHQGGELYKRDEYTFFLVYYESIKREVKIKPIYECRCNGRLKTKRFMSLAHTGLVVELEHLKIKTRLTNEKFPSVKGEVQLLFVYYESMERTFCLV